MSLRQFIAVVDGWAAAHKTDGGPERMSERRFDELLKQYG